MLSESTTRRRNIATVCGEPCYDARGIRTGPTPPAEVVRIARAASLAHYGTEDSAFVREVEAQARERGQA